MQLGKRSLKKIQGFTRVRTCDLQYANAGAMLYQLSYEATHLEPGHLMARIVQLLLSAVQNNFSYSFNNNLMEKVKTTPKKSANLANRNSIKTEKPRKLASKKSPNN